LVHCAGVLSQQPLRALDASKFEAVQRVNVTAAAMLAKGFRQKGCCAPNSSIVLVSSVMGLVGQAGIPAYSTSKAAVAGLTRCLAMELARESIRVNCVAPGMVRTEMTEKFFEFVSDEYVKGIEALHPLGFGTARDVANAIAFLISDAARWITGSTLVVDGGYTAH
jgi:NAD(P)-dependent dehydrogenase (short-subunit alcohol dehydrogenase family)